MAVKFWVKIIHSSKEEPFSSGETILSYTVINDTVSFYVQFNQEQAGIVPFPFIPEQTHGFW